MKTSFDLMKSLNENTLPKIKKTRVLSEKENKLNEGAGAGYNITGTIDASTVNSFNIVETTEDKYGTPTYLLDCDISATLEDVTFESYYDGGHVDSAQIQITKLLLVDNHDPEEKGELNNDNIKQSLDETQVKSLIGAGWIHSTFDGNIEFKEENADGSVYSDFYVYGIEYHFIDEELVKFIDLAVQGENVVEEYIVYSEDYDELDRFDSEEEAIEYAKNTPNAVKVEEISYRYEFDGDVDINSEYSETVWEKDDFEESEEHDLSKDLLGDEANKRKSEDQKSLEAYLRLANEIKDGKNDTITLDSAKELVKNAYVKAKGYASFEPEEINKRIAKDIPELFGESNELNEKLNSFEKTTFSKKVLDAQTDEELKQIVNEIKPYSEPTYTRCMEIINGDGSTQYKAGQISDILYQLNESNMEEVREKSAEKGLLEPEAVNEEIIDEEVVSDKLTEVKSQGNVYMLQDNDKYIVGEDYDKEENLIENAEIYNNKEEADKDYFSRCDITHDGEQVDPTEPNLEKEEEPTEEA